MKEQKSQDSLILLTFVIFFSSKFKEEEMCN
jgi:hypothetical protein